MLVVQTGISFALTRVSISKSSLVKLLCGNRCEICKLFFFSFFFHRKEHFGKNNKYSASQLQRETWNVTSNLHLFCGQQDVNLGVEGVNLALFFFCVCAYKIDQK